MSFALGVIVGLVVGLVVGFVIGAAAMRAPTVMEREHQRARRKDGDA
jgi:uncharacterized membrane-anchored protein YhcB (DUF1043 family)